MQDIFASISFVKHVGDTKSHMGTADKVWASLRLSLMDLIDLSHKVLYTRKISTPNMCENLVLDILLLAAHR